MMKNFISFFLVLSIFSTHVQGTLVKGNSTVTGETFSFDIGFAKFNANTENSAQRIWTASGQDLSAQEDSVKEYGLSYTIELPSYLAPLADGTTITPTAVPMTTETATIFSFDGTTAISQPGSNPIWGAQFAFFDTINTKPIFVLANSLNKFYWTQDIQKFTNPDDDHVNKTELLLYTFTDTNDEIKNILGTTDSAYVLHATGVFGTATTKIAKIISSTAKVNETTNIPCLQLFANTEFGTNTSALIGSGANLAAIGSNSTMALFAGNLYVGLDVTAAAGASDCATGIMIAKTSTTNGVSDFDFIQIAPDVVINDSGINTVISATTSNQIRIKKIAGMKTSTGLTYLIIAQDFGTAPQNIYAVPIVSQPGADLGKVADFTSINELFTTNPNMYRSRSFDTVITNAAQIDPTGAFAQQLLVGQDYPNITSPNSIADMYVVGDSVYAVINVPYGTCAQRPGTMKSQAIFAQDGHIIGWTPWTRVLGSDDQMNWSYVNSKTTVGSYLALVGGNPRALFQTQWTNTSNLAPFVVSTSSMQGGIQAMFNFPQETNGFNCSISLLAATGYNQLTLGQTGAINGGFFTIQTMASTDVLTFSNINNHKALVAAELAHNGTNHWLFVGGTTGLSVLTGDLTGYTWTGNLANLSTDPFLDQTWKLLGDFTYIKKLISDNTFLYVLTSTALYQISLDPNKFIATNPIALNAQIILNSSSLGKNSYFLDCIIDDNFCIIGSTNGLFTFNISTSSLNQISVPDGLSCANQLLAISTSTQGQRSFKTLSNLYILNNTFGTQQARLNRFVIQDSTILPFNDFLQATTSTSNTGKPTSFIRFDQYVSNYFTDGSWNLASVYFLGVTQPAGTFSPSILQIQAGVCSGFSSSQIIMPNFAGYLPTGYLARASMLNGLIRESTSGALISSGNFEALVDA